MQELFTLEEEEEEKKEKVSKGWQIKSMLDSSPRAEGVSVRWT